MWKLCVVCCLLSLTAVIGSPNAKKHDIQEYINNPAIQKFREYLQINTNRPENLDEAVKFWERQAKEADLPITVIRPGSKPIVVLTWAGSNPSLPSIMLNSHMDVVSAEQEGWIYPPFEAVMDDEGNIYARGSQDTKDVSLQYLEAIKILKLSNVTLERTIHITLMPDEESGSIEGIDKFLRTETFKEMNVGFVLDEGWSSTTETLYATYVDKRAWMMIFHVVGTSGHGSQVLEDSAMKKIQRLINVVMAFREEQQSVMESKDPLDFGAYTSVNINMLQGGIARNIIPVSVTAVIDARLATSMSAENMTDLINSWKVIAGNGTTVEFKRMQKVSTETPTDSTNPYWVAMQEAASELGIDIVPLVCPATSDMVKVRNYGIPAFGFSAKSHTINRAHGINEYLNAKTYLDGIQVYVTIIKKLGNLL